MIYTVTIVETSHPFPQIQTTSYATLDKAIAEIDKYIYEHELGHDEIQPQMKEIIATEFGDLRFEESGVYINLDYFCSAY